jgi:hypothetical protein
VGTEDAKYRRDAMNYVLRSHFRPAMSEGCPIWSRVDVAITNMGITREKR